MIDHDHPPIRASPRLALGPKPLRLTASPRAFCVSGQLAATIRADSEGVRETAWRGTTAPLCPTAAVRRLRLEKERQGEGKFATPSVLGVCSPVKYFWEATKGS